MRFETPKMNISMFEVENILTNASDPSVQTANTELAQNALMSGSNAVAAANIFEFQY